MQDWKHDPLALSIRPRYPHIAFCVHVFIAEAGIILPRTVHDVGLVGLVALRNGWIIDAKTWNPTMLRHVLGIV